MIIVALGMMAFFSPVKHDTTLGRSEGGAADSVQTKAFAPGRQEFTHYTVPGLCRAAAHNTRNVEQRTLEAQYLLDTTYTDPVRDSLGAGRVAVVARTCITNFSVATVAAWDLDDLFELAILAQNDSLAHMVLARQIALAPTSFLKDSIRLEKLNMFLAAQPARLAAAEHLITQYDKSADSNAFAAMRIHATMMGFWRQVGDTGQERVHAERVIAIGHAQPSRRWTLHDVGDLLYETYSVLMELAADTDTAAKMLVAQRAQHDLRQVHLDLEQDRLGIVTPLFIVERNKHLPAMSVEDWKTELEPIVYKQEHDAHTPAPQVHADFWFPANPGSNTAWPVPGKVNLIINGGGGDIAMFIRRTLARYGSQGLVVTIVRATCGNSGSLMLGQLRGPWTPQEEAKELQWYFQSYEHLPVTVSVLESHWTFLAQPDGRRIATDTTTFPNNRNTTGCGLGVFEQTGQMMLTERDGRAVYQGRPIERGRMSAGDAHQTVLVEGNFSKLLAWTMAQPIPAHDSGTTSVPLQKAHQ